MVTLSGHAYCWDVLGDPAFAGRAAELGLDSVTLAAAYHSVRAATPLHPHHQVVEARYAALYRPVRASVWRSRRLRPLAPDWMDAPDPFRTAASALSARGLGVVGWVVLTHNTRLGTEHPDVTVTNCFGDRYPYALCPSWDEVRDYAALLAAEAVHEVPLSMVSLESCGQLGVVHAGHHDKTVEAWDEQARRWLSVCCCPACRRAWVTAGADPERIVGQLRAAVRTGSAVDDAELILGARLRAAEQLRRQCAGALGGTPVLLHAGVDPWATGPSPGHVHATPARLLLNAWAVAPSTVEAVATAVGRGDTVHAYVTALSPVRGADLPGHVRALVGAGASGIHLYHLGLAPARRQQAMHAVAKILEKT
ncbi:hypothetical protein ACFFX1_39655 [Dactylosporangium sucinum]|uniref:Alanine-rich protein n=1 Tax=Dactylosporangium sucinum TaxID=1424081 RepID=A0A917WH24_9ACTN|nr:hypothetical protein [Dactylosporangium sucinum]GGM02811.1 hypothetical protein GCM10007977_000230 [Dactylosporangium sucinum]